ncbi:hypothetical protein V5E97_29180 [Singulisphaera sp. Ch08]|uniref:Secreted protein n=1 Tax=Singulisphaera sp. Ch08 TaxID=3120278 RepID=A0AAU7CAW4_9BACT
MLGRSLFLSITTTRGWVCPVQFGNSDTNREWASVFFSSSTWKSPEYAIYVEASSRYSSAVPSNQSSAANGRRSGHINCAPSAAKARAIARPMP